MTTFSKQQNVYGSCIVAAALFLSFSATALEEVPVYLKKPAAPNIAFTVDDSGSMAWGAVPDAIVGLVATNRYRAASFNPLAYDPSAIYKIPKQSSGLPFPNSFRAAWLNGHLQAGPRNLTNQFQRTDSNSVANGVNETVVQVPRPGGGNQPDIAGPAYYYLRLDLLPPTAPAVTPAETAACPAINPNADGCYRRIFVSTTSGYRLDNGTVVRDEEQNFANWFSFFRARHLLVKSALMNALYDIDPTTRVTWQGFYNRCGFRGIDGDACTQGYGLGADYDNQIKPFGTAHRAEMFRWLGQLPSDTNTPLREAFQTVDQYFRLTGVNNPWGDIPGTTEAPMNACRVSYHIALTDGIWNGLNQVAVGNVDGGNVTLGDGVSTYTPMAPYSDTTSNSLADIAFRSWSQDLQPGIPNVVPAYNKDGKTGSPTVRNAANPSAWTNADYWNPQNDPATWQHVVTATIGLGLGRSITNPQWMGGTWTSNPAGTAGYATIANGTSPWPAVARDSPNNPYDLWHAALNGRGEFFSADTADGVYNAIQSIFTRISARIGSAGSVTTASGYAVGAGAAYSSEYDSSTWSGVVLRYPVDEDGSIDSSVGATTSTADNTYATPPVPSAFTNSAVAINRKVFTRNDFASASAEFKWANLTAASRASITNNTNDADMVAYLRGDRSLEVGQGCEATSTCKFRRRGKMLGDVLAGSPVLSAKEDFGYSRASWATDPVRQAYVDYLKNNKGTRQPVVLVGANDGMFHILNATTLAEMYAYVPKALHSKMWRLTEQIYVKKAFVDGPISIGDAYAGGAWGTYAISTLGAGGKSVTAFDITNPGSFGASTSMWEFTHPDLGYVTSKPVIARMADGTWAVIFSGGFENGDNTAVLFAVDLRTGNLISRSKITGITNGCSANSNAPNGLGAVSTLNKRDGSMLAYAGDLWGNLWRFESTASNPAVRLSFSGSPLFKACNSAAKPQAITAAPSVSQFGLEPIVFFGTGRIFEGPDLSSNQTQSFYSVIDDGVAPSTYDRSSRLGQQTILNTGTATKVVSQNAVNLVSKRGWYLDLTDNKERIVAQPTLIDGRILFPSFVPEDSSCESDGYSWVYNLDALDGSAPRTGVFDTNGDQKISAADQQNASALRVKATLSSVTSIRVLDTPKTSTPAGGTGGGTGGGSGNQKTSCGKGQVKLVASRVYEKGYTELCTPSATMRSGWRQLR